MNARNVFGFIAFGAAITVIGLVLSPWVPDTKDAIANVILGNVLGWPAIVLAYHFGTTQSSAEKNRVLATMADTATGRPSDPLHVEVEQ